MPAVGLWKTDPVQSGIHSRWHSLVHLLDVSSKVVSACKSSFGVFASLGFALERLFAGVLFLVTLQIAFCGKRLLADVARLALDVPANMIPSICQHSTTSSIQEMLTCISDS